MAKIAVIGMGQGGMVAAIKLANCGHSVSVFEQNERGEVSYSWKDDIRSDIFKICDLPMPDESIFVQKSKWVFVSPNEKYRLPVPPCPPMEEISIDRRGLSEYFAILAENAGCELYFGVRIDMLVLNGDKVCGISVDGKELPYDLVIDASGLRSVLRVQIPNKFGVQKQPEDSGVMYGYRAFFKRVEGADTVEQGINCTMILKHLSEQGISWCNLSDDGSVDVLIGRINKLDDGQIDKALAALKAYNPILSDELISERRVDICLRATMAIAVADGYVAIGDSAFMTMPLMGSGIESSMKAGKLLADTIDKNKITNFTAENLWAFNVKYMRKMGADFAFIDVLKRWALGLNPKRIDWVFGSGVINAKDLAMVSTDGDGKFKIRAKTIFMILAHPVFLCSAVKCVLRGLRASKCAKKIPAKYDIKRIAIWRKKYDKLLVI